MAGRMEQEILALGGGLLERLGLEAGGVLEELNVDVLLGDVHVADNGAAHEEVANGELRDDENPEEELRRNARSVRDGDTSQRP